MVVLLDTAEYRVADRDEAVQAVVEQMSVPTEVSLLGSAHVNTRMDVFQMGEVSALRNEGRPIRLHRTAKHVRRAAPEVVSMIVQIRGSAVHYQEEHTQVSRPGELLMADLSGAYESDTGLATLAMYLPYSLLGVNVEVGRRAMLRLNHSPVYELTRRHLAGVERDIDRLSSGVAASAVSESTVQLVRALLLTAAEHNRQGDALHETLTLRILDYINQNLGDSELTPERIARHHHISLRTLYNQWSAHHISLMEWIIQARLDRARIDLCKPTSSGAAVSVASIARRWGFRDPAHFSRRFRQRYGIAPIEWRIQSAAMLQSMTASRPTKMSGQDA